MTETTDTTPEPAAPAPQPRAGRRRLIVGLAAGAAVLAVGISAFALTRDDDQPQTAATQQIAAARQACQQWLDNDTASRTGGPGARWCDDMASWMTDNTTNGQMMMGPMWDSPQAMRDVCVQAMGADQTGNGDPAQWCDQMVGWMSQRMGDWDNWHDQWDD